MYNALNEDYMFQVIHDRADQMSGRHTSAHVRPDRRWWRKVARVAR